MIRVLGEEMGSISDLFVAKWSGDGGRCRLGLGEGKDKDDSGGWVGDLRVTR